ncbi:MAG TPA: HAD hydrolase family protein [Burkholderiaceae bacterium]|jgi:3-deoxy-D-manno-octulosonate 8-phosphate phosphatase (KDO 8-P phosphatase)|nr:HAD hydrolase family protein [Burkholderiaceae bacterium]
MTDLLREDAVARASRVRLMIFDVDGVLTDGSLHYGANGESMKTFNVLDGFGILQLQRVGIATAIITARKSDIVAKRAADLGIAHVFQGSHDKRAGFEELLARTSVEALHCGYVGDDIIDLPVLSRVGFAASVPNGRPEVQARVHYVTQAGGGNGAVRELSDFILHAQGKYQAALAPYLT